MQFGIQHPNFSFNYDGQDNNVSNIADSLKNLITKAENSGFDSFWVMDHFHQIQFVGRPEEPMLEGWTVLSMLAGITTKIKIGTLVTGIIYRYPSVLAKVAATLDILSKGRLFMGIGAAWNEQESLAYGISFPSNQERLLRLEEAIQIIRKMWTEEPYASFKGKYYQINNAYCNPKPIQKPSPPILVGGSGERKTLKIVAKYADACNLFGSIESVKNKLGILKEHCKNVGRDYDSILKTKLGTIVVDDNKEVAKNRVRETFRGIPEDQIKEFVIYGTPEDIQRQIEALEQVGIQYLIVNFESSKELEALDTFANKIITKM
ncbi:MAG TPA: LLM class F420-dependent oxidoreductase [Candidatus Sulfopaludibacter sp.]|jgi:F420-dependent oxidoreductase-like protein|nr:LLM class F420-dependent oxidoreductase [Candidatus Sulfopaludibacter sp.]